MKQRHWAEWRGGNHHLAGTVADDGIVTVRQPAYEGVGVGQLGGTFDVRAADRSVRHRPVRDVVRDGVCEERRGLAHGADGGEVGVAREGGTGDPVDRHRPARRLIKTAGGRKVNTYT